MLKDGVAVETDEDLLYMMVKVTDCIMPYEGGKYILTDDKAPVELLGMKMIDALIQNEVVYYKEIYDTEGIQGLIDML